MKIQSNNQIFTLVTISLQDLFSHTNYTFNVCIIMINHDKGNLKAFFIYLFF